MVFLTLVTNGCKHFGFGRPSKFYRHRRIFRITSYLYGKRRNCYRVAIRAAQHVLQDARLGRKRKKQDMKELHELRTESALVEHGLPLILFQSALQRCQILLNRKAIADLAMWEPRSFKALADVAKERVYEDKMQCPPIAPGLNWPIWEEYKPKPKHPGPMAEEKRGFQAVKHFFTRGLLGNK